MQKTTKKKLSLSTETVRKLQVQELRGIAGGQTAFTCSDLCGDTDACPDTQFIHGCNSK